MDFYEDIKKLDKIKKFTIPTNEDLKEVRKICANNIERIKYFYDNEPIKLRIGWLELLDNAGEFEVLNSIEASKETVSRLKAIYLVDCAYEKPEVVLGIIKKIKAKDVWIQGKLTEAILQMPEDIAIKVIPVITGYLQGKEIKIWFFIGEAAAKLMVKLSKNYPDKAFELAVELVEAWGTTDEYKLKDMVAKFEESGYEKLIFEYYSKLFDVDAFRATNILINILERHVKEASKRDKYDVSSIYYIRMENLEEIDIGFAGILAILVKGICEGGRAVIQKQPGKVKELLDYLEGQNKEIFNRIEMYLLRHMPKGVKTERINRIIDNNEFLKKPGYEYEYKLLLRDKFEEIDDTVIKRFVERVKNIKKTEEERKEIKEWCEKNNEPLPDFEKMGNWLRAEELYLVRDKFEELYKEYVKKADVKDESKLAPRKMVSEARYVSPMEGTPLNSEEMSKRKVNEVLDYVSNPKNYEEQKKRRDFRDSADALRATFKEDVKKRFKEYLECDIQKIKELPVLFLENFFYGIEEAVRDGSFEKNMWGRLIEFACEVVKERSQDKSYRNCFSAIIWALRDSFSKRDNAIELDMNIAKKFWSILQTIVHFPIEDISGFIEDVHNEDPMQINCSLVAGETLGVTISFGIECKNRLENYWQKELKIEMRKCWEFVLTEIKDAGVNCVFGADFSRIYWLDSEWVEGHLDEMFSEELWDEVWGTYTTWGKPSPNGFQLLVKRGKYEQAVNLLGTANKFKYGKEPENGLVEHLMIGFFNGWISLEDSVLVKFFKKASANLRGKAARFLTTGFEQVNKEDKAEEKKKTAARMREYWNKRIAAIKDKPEENKDEAIELTGWVEDSVLPAKETLGLLEQSLHLSEGKIGKMRNARHFVEGVRKLGKGNELQALRCLKKAAADENMHMQWSRIQEPLVSFLETTIELPEEIRSAAKEVADLYGRYNPETFRGVWEKLNATKQQ